LLQQQQSQIEEALNRAQNDLIHKLAEECGLQIHEFDAILQPIIDSCTKESIANGNYDYDLFIFFFLLS
jgi:calcium homeostasis endoplasmic reticulum protein